MKLIKDWLDSIHTPYSQIINGEVDNLEVISFFHQGKLLLAEHSIDDPDFYRFSLFHIDKVDPENAEAVLEVINKLNHDKKLVKTVYHDNIVDLNAELFFIHDVLDEYSQLKFYKTMERIMLMLHQANFTYCIETKWLSR